MTQKDKCSTIFAVVQLKIDLDLNPVNDTYDYFTSLCVCSAKSILLLQWYLVINYVIEKYSIKYSICNFAYEKKKQKVFNMSQHSIVIILMYALVIFNKVILCQTLLRKMSYEIIIFLYIIINTV